VPTADYSQAVLTLDDLPFGYVEIPNSEFEDSFDFSSGEAGLEYSSVFIFMNPIDFEIIMGFTTLITRTIQQTTTDLQLNNPDLLMDFFVSGLTSDIQTTVEKIPITGLDDIGDSSAGLRILMSDEELSMKFDIAIFRQGEVMGLLMLMYEDGTTPSISIQELAQKFDQRVVDVQLAVP
jgi:hypothetical protein